MTTKCKKGHCATKSAITISKVVGTLQIHASTKRSLHKRNVQQNFKDGKNLSDRCRSQYKKVTVQKKTVQQKIQRWLDTSDRCKYKKVTAQQKTTNVSENMVL